MSVSVVYTITGDSVMTGQCCLNSESSYAFEWLNGCPTCREEI